MFPKTPPPARTILDILIARWQRISLWVRMGSILAISARGVATASCFERYRRWRAIVAGGLPFNFKGYMLNVYVAITMAYRDTMTLNVYDHPAKHSSMWAQAAESERAAAFIKFLKTDLPRRHGPQARAMPFVIPQRERNEHEYVDREVKRLYLEAFDGLQVQNDEATDWKTSLMEKRGRTMVLKDVAKVSTLSKQPQGEVCHVHASDLSGRVTLSHADAREVVRKGWGERHRLSGTEIIPLGYTMTFVFRDVEEVEIFLSIFQAGIDYMQQGK